MPSLRLESLTQAQLEGDAAAIARRLPGWLEQERALLPALEQLGVPRAELLILQGDLLLLGILSEEAEELAAQASRAELSRTFSHHRARLARVAALVPPQPI